MSELEEEKIKLEQKRKRLLLSKKLLKEKEKQIQARKLQVVGKLSQKAGIANIDQTVLLGAFLEIAERAKDPSMQKQWRGKGELHQENESEQEALMISFATAPDSEMKSQLKAMGFKWNKFRKEFYGYGERKSIESKFKGFNFQIEVAE